ncbi:MAG: glycosyl hydrolase family 39 [Herbinix sp.]|nr:glycosyl hydrolase family 39 [Herbinix sp.]
MKKSLKKYCSILLVFAFILVFSWPVTPAFAADNITVDCSNVLRGVTHCASGSLYGVTESVPVDVAGLITPLHPNVFRNPARGGSGNQHPFGAAIPTAARVASTGAKISVDLADMLPGWPYTWPGMTSWLNQVTSFVNDKKASGLTNWYGIEPWNEPDGTWNSANGDFNSTLWKQTYDKIRSLDPSFKIIGPDYSYYNHNTMSTFLTYCKNNNCLPDIISWHELSGIQNVANNLKDYRSLEASLGISERPISISEYCDANHNLEGQPGSLGEFFGKFERYKVTSACITWWFTNSCRLGSLLATNTQKGAGWYMMNWYGEMTGNMVNVSVANDATANMDGAACVDSTSKYISVVLGGGNSGAVNTVIKNIPSFIGSTAKVMIQKVDWVSKDTVCNGTTTVSTSNYTVTNGQITVPMTGCNASSGYRIYVTPGSVSGSSYEAESGTLSNGAVIQSASFCSGGNKVGYLGGSSNGTVIINNVNVSTAGTYSLTIYYVSSDNRTIYVTPNGGSWFGVQCPGSGSWSTLSSITTSVTLNAGNNTIKLDNGTSGNIGAPDIDRIVIN